MLYQRDFVPVVAGAASVNKSSSSVVSRASGREGGREGKTSGARSVHRDGIVDFSRDPARFRGNGKRRVLVCTLNVDARARTGSCRGNLQLIRTACGALRCLP